MTDTPVTPVSDNLRVVPEFRPGEHDTMAEILSGKLDRRLARFRTVELELSVKDRDSAQQRAVLECWVDGTKLVATSTKRELPAAVAELRDDLFRQVDRHVNRQRPKTSRQRRER